MIGGTNQKGAALVVAMLVLSLVVVFTANMTIENNFNTRRVQNQLIQQQADAYIRGVEGFAHKALWSDFEYFDRPDGLRVDHYNEETWPSRELEVPTDEGFYAGYLMDLQGRFNVNTLRPPPGFDPLSSSNIVPYTVEQGIFIRLLVALGDDDYIVSYDEARAITEAVVDWLDQDNNPSGFECGEDDSYASLEGRVPHRVANHFMASVSELSLICNMPTELYQRLKPHVTVWPRLNSSSINLNTATPELLRALLYLSSTAPTDLGVPNSNGSGVKFKNIDRFYEPVPHDLENDYFYPDERSFESYQAFFDAFPGYALWKDAKVSLHSEYFLLRAYALVGDYEREMDSVIMRVDEAGITRITTLARIFPGTYSEINKIPEEEDEE